MIYKFHFKKISGFLCILVLSFYTYIPGYQKPASLFWDENFHIASAQRYLNNVFFLEPHPPLGKLVIAAGEYLFKFNDVNNQFISEEKAEDIPDGFSFAGYRLFPVIFAALIAPLIYLIILKITQNSLLSFTIALAPTFDNAMIVHNRGAMLESTQIFFLLLSILTYLSIYNDQITGTKKYILHGVFCALSITTKINSLPILLLPLILIISKKEYYKFLIGFVVSFILTYLLIWQTHFALSTKVNRKLDGDGLFGVSSYYKNIIITSQSSNPKYLIHGILESFDYFKRYQTGVPSLNLNKRDENGSRPILWPIGARTINYRWQKDGDQTQYLYLVPNAASWLMGLLGISASIAIISFRRLNFIHFNLHQSHFIPLLIIYLTTWLSPLLMNRVFYLYHYFVPLCISWLLLGASVALIKLPHQLKINLYKLILIIVLFISIVIVCVYNHFSPLTYYKPLSDAELINRSWIKAWDLRCSNCPSTHTLSKENDYASNISDSSWRLAISGLEANNIEQSHGTPIQDNHNLEIQTKSKIQFPINRRFLSFKGAAKTSQLLPKDTIVEVIILVDGVTKWSKFFDHTSNNTATFDIPISDSSILTLIAKSRDTDKISIGIIWQDLTLLPLTR